MDVSILSIREYHAKLPKSRSGLVAMTYDRAMLRSAWPRKMFLSHPRKTDRRSRARSFSFLVSFVRMASASSPPPPASHWVVVRGDNALLLFWGRVAPVSVASSLRRL